MPLPPADLAVRPGAGPAHWWRGSVLALLGLLLAACQTPAVENVPAAPAPDAASPAPAEPATAALPPQPVIDDDPQRLMGLDPLRLNAILGVPELIRREPPAEIWQYRGATCVFDVFLYDTAGVRTVTYLEARDDAAQRTAERGCLNELLRARLNGPLG